MSSSYHGTTLGHQRLSSVVALAFAASAAATLSGSPVRGDDTVEIQVWLTASADDDYVTWAPAACQARLKPPVPAPDDVKVVLTNDPPQAPPPGRTVPLDGDVVFASSLATGQTAAQDTLELVLPKSGDWVPFVIAGKFGRPSERKGDAIIQAHQGDASGPLVGSQSLMVRVRKKASTLTTYERDEFLGAIADVKAASGGAVYQQILRVHFLAVNAAPPFGNIPDQAHKNAAFLAWHRAYLLQFERSLQQVRPHVALHYWKEDELSVPPASGDTPDVVAVFSTYFAGTNGSSFALENVVLDPANPLYGWDISGTALSRTGYPRNDTSWVRSEADVLNYTSYRNAVNPSSGDSFSFFLESNPHNDGHGWIGGWMQSCRTSPQDPIFWLFHCDIDRYWAKWQWRQGRFGNDGSDVRDYAPNDSYATGSAVPLGHHLKDTMWPWDGKTGIAMPPDPRANRPASAPGSPFPKSPSPGFWPEAPATPIVAKMIDYLAITGSELQLGFCYDDTPYGSSAAPPSAVVVNHLARFQNKNLPMSERLAAGQSGSVPPDQINSLIDVLKNQQEPDEVRHTALRMLSRADERRAIVEGSAIVTDPTKGGPRLRSKAAETLGVIGMFSESGRSRLPEIRKALHSATSDPDPSVRLAAMSALVSTADSAAIDTLKTALEQPEGSKFSKAEAIRFLGLAGPGVHVNAIRPHLKDPDPQVREAALHALGGDQASYADRRAILLSRDQPGQVRVAAVLSLVASGPQAADDLMGLLRDAGETPDLRSHAAGGLRVMVQRNPDTFQVQNLEAVAKDLESLSQDANPSLRRSAEAALTQVKKTLQSKGR